MIILCCLANTINYVDRANLAVAAPIMTRELGIDAAEMVQGVTDGTDLDPAKPARADDTREGY